MQAGMDKADIFLASFDLETREFEVLAEDF